MESHIINSVENTILALFDKLSYQHYYNEEFLKNITIITMVGKQIRPTK